jgi:hypothetical protein
MGRKANAAVRIDETPARGHCVVCGSEGKSVHDFICGDCGDPLGATLFCRRCQRRLVLEPDAARAFLAENGYPMEDVQGVVLKVDRCGQCMAEDEVVDMDVYRLRFGR